jgi:hypothetical protein
VAAGPGCSTASAVEECSRSTARKAPPSTTAVDNAVAISVRAAGERELDDAPPASFMGDHDPG